MAMTTRQMPDHLSMGADRFFVTAHDQIFICSTNKQTLANYLVTRALNNALGYVF